MGTFKIGNISLKTLDKLKSLQPITMTEWEAERERAEFEQAARLYRPLSAAFSDRFVSASQPDESTDPLTPVSRLTTGVDQDVVNAAKLKMFGRLTRRIGEWQPHSILCKRFNIPVPGRSSVPTKPSRPKFSIFNFLEAAPFNAPVSTTVSECEDTSNAISVPPTPAPVTADNTTKVTAFISDEDVEKLAESTNKMDLYKAIFLSSSDESDDDDEKQTPPDQLSQTTSERKSSPPKGIFANLETINAPLKTSSPAESFDKTAKEINILRNSSPPRGIFANLDLINSQSKKTTNFSSDSRTAEVEDVPTVQGETTETEVSNKGEQTSICDTEISTTDKQQTQSNECLMYGPSLPQTVPQARFITKCHTKESSSESDEWVEQDVQSSSSDGSNHRRVSKKKHSKKSHKKSKKHKYKKHKKKRSK